MIIRLADGTELPPTLDGHQVADLFGISYWSLLGQVRAGTCPVTPLRLGRKIKWSTASVLRALGLEMEGGVALQPARSTRSTAASPP
jgi:hypothetical protein